MVVLPLDKLKFRGRFGEEMHNNPELVVMAFTVSSEIREEGTFFKERYEHLADCENCHQILREQIKFY